MSVREELVYAYDNAVAGQRERLRTLEALFDAGTVAELALALGEAGVNIEDMALYPAPDMTSGAVSVWVSGAEQARRAVDLIEGLGHSVSVLDGE